FRHLLFKVTEDVLIPRLETELLVEHVLKIASSYPPPLKIVDVGTGSGAIALSLAYELPEAIVYALDISKEALKIASENAQNYNLNDKVFFVESDLFSNLKNVLNCPVDVIVSNPPYISSESLKSLQREVYRFEPLVALDGGENGLEIISRIINESFEYLQPRGCLALEVGFGQAKKVVDLFKQGNCFEEIEIFSDYAGVERFVVGFKKSL
ncbi:MAG: peptide chain release factor N(5)-glutamine methyltransferase, partial [Candidatus Subteraquimicrobiales bacterium]|nr:peptide chain release factor N(5)-glutamine methyltransferase [Candidatus Subteraquimicrobiales bacterium]